MQKLAVVYFPQLLTKEIDNFREKYDPSYKIIPIHITIVPPLSGINEDQLIDHIKLATKDIKSFPIHFSGLTKTQDNCLFLQVKEGGDQIINLHNQLCSGLSNYLENKFRFDPHMTLGDFSDESFSEAEKMNLNITCEFDNLTVIKGDGISPAKTLFTLTF